MCVCFSLLARGQTEVAPRQRRSNRRQKRRPWFVNTNTTVPSNDIYELYVALQSCPVRPPHKERPVRQHGVHHGGGVRSRWEKLAPEGL